MGRGKIKDITEIVEGHVSVEDKQMLIAAFLKHNYGSTMIQAIKTVIPAKKKSKRWNGVCVSGGAGGGSERSPAYLYP